MAMEYVKLGNTGMDVSPICLGCMSFASAEGWTHNPWALDEVGSREIIKRALDLGINFFDTSNVYAYGVSLEDAVKSVDVQLAPDDIAYMEKPYVPHPLVGLIPYGG